MDAKSSGREAIVRRKSHLSQFRFWLVGGILLGSSLACNLPVQTPAHWLYSSGAQQAALQGWYDPQQPAVSATPTPFQPVSPTPVGQLERTNLLPTGTAQSPGDSPDGPEDSGSSQGAPQIAAQGVSSAADPAPATASFWSALWNSAIKPIFQAVGTVPSATSTRLPFLTRTGTQTVSAITQAVIGIGTNLGPVLTAANTSQPNPTSPAWTVTNTVTSTRPPATNLPSPTIPPASPPASSTLIRTSSPTLPPAHTATNTVQAVVSQPTLVPSQAATTPVVFVNTQPATSIPASPTQAPPTATQVPPTATQVPPTPEPPTPVPPTPEPPTPEPPACAPSGDGGAEATLLAMINQERANQGLGPLAAQGQLAAAARIHSQDMACNNFFSHTGSDGSTFASRIYAQGYGFSAAGENLYAGGGAADAFYAWMNSAGHRANMLNPGYTEAGIGYIYEPNSPYGSYFTAEFAAP